ncbi:MAG: hypothetical protein ABF301_03735 [Sulfurovum sp.]|jgi:hypothetical protein
MEENKEQILDIMPYANIDINFYNYMWLAICVVVFIVTLIYLLKKIPQKIQTKELSIKELAVKNLNELNIDTKDTKEVLYEFTKNAKLCTNEYNEKKLDIILKQIEPLKYQNTKVVLDEKTKQMLKGYIKDELY